MKPIHVIIPAGGAGTRLWPLSRRNSPKFLLDVAGTGDTMVQATVKRLEPVAASITIVTGGAHRDAVVDQLPEFSGADPLRQVLIEPEGRDSMPAIGAAAYLIRQRFGDDAVVGSFAADHVIARPDLFAETVRQAARAAVAGWVVTIGIKPTGASSAYGYIQPKTGLAVSGDTAAIPVAAFVEKPDTARAERFVADGYLWNAGMFVMRAGTLAKHLEDLKPDMHRGLERLAAAWGSDHFQAEVAAVWPTLEKIAIDHAVAEPVAAAGGVAVVAAPQELGWTDVGDFAALKTLRASDPVVAVDAEDCVAFSNTQQVVSVVGADHLVVVVTKDAVLVTTPEHAQQVKRAVQVLPEMGLESLE